MTLLLERPQSGTAIADANGLPTPYFMTFIQTLCETLEANDVTQQETIDALVVAQAAADAAQAAAETAQTAADDAQAAAATALSSANDAATAAADADAAAGLAQAKADIVEDRIDAYGIP